MPKTEDKFKTVIDRRDSATVIRKGSKADKAFEADRAENMDWYKDRDENEPNVLAKKYPRLNNKIEKGAASMGAAREVGDQTRRAAQIAKDRSKYAKK